jgi:hypothetical protein
MTLTSSLSSSLLPRVITHTHFIVSRGRNAPQRRRREKARKRKNRINLSGLRAQAAGGSTTTLYILSLVACFRLNTSNYDETEDVDGSLDDGTSSCNKRVCFRFAKTSSSSCGEGVAPVRKK